MQGPAYVGSLFTLPASPRNNKMILVPFSEQTCFFVWRGHSCPQPLNSFPQEGCSPAGSAPLSRPHNLVRIHALGALAGGLFTFQ
jgi:hypothetical protein